MDLKRELVLTIGALVLVNLLFAFGSIGLFVRMGPAIERILQENVYSIGAAEQILSELAASPGPLTDEARARVLGALERARENVTEEDERPVFRAIDEALPAALEGHPESRALVATELSTLIAINSSAMARVVGEARRLGTAGAWSAVLVGFLSFTLSLFVVVRLRKRLLAPLVELHDVLESVRAGNRLRRCRHPDAPLELMQVGQSVNALLDERLTRAAKKPESTDELERLALLHLLHHYPGGAAVVDRRGTIVRASEAMLELLAGEDGERIRSAASGARPLDDEAQRVPLGDDGWLFLVSSNSAS